MTLFDNLIFCYLKCGKKTAEMSLLSLTAAAGTPTIDRHWNPTRGLTGFWQITVHLAAQSQTQHELDREAGREDYGRNLSGQENDNWRKIWCWTLLLRKILPLKEKNFQKVFFASTVCVEEKMHAQYLSVSQWNVISLWIITLVVTAPFPSASDKSQHFTVRVRPGGGKKKNWKCMQWLSHSGFDLILTSIRLRQKSY